MWVQGRASGCYVPPTDRPSPAASGKENPAELAERRLLQQAHETPLSVLLAHRLVEDRRPPTCGRPRLG